jgi:hypothetical protein
MKIRILLQRVFRPIVNKIIFHVWKNLFCPQPTYFRPTAVGVEVEYMTFKIRISGSAFKPKFNLGHLKKMDSSLLSNSYFKFRKEQTKIGPNFR